MINCKQAVTINDKSQYGEAGLNELIKMNLHLLMCSSCRAYAKENKKITRILSSLNKKQQSIRLSMEQKKQIIEKLQNRNE